MKFFMILITVFASLAGAEELVLTTPSAPNMGLSKPANDKDTEGEFSDVTGVSQNQARKDGRVPSANCPTCGHPNGLTDSDGNPVVDGSGNPVKTGTEGGADQR